MSSDKPALRLRDIIENARAILDYTSGMTAEAFARERLVYVRLSAASRGLASRQSQFCWRIVKHLCVNCNNPADAAASQILQPPLD